MTHEIISIVACHKILSNFLMVLYCITIIHNASFLLHVDLFVTTTLPNKEKEFRFEIWQNKVGIFSLWLMFLLHKNIELFYLIS